MKIALLKNLPTTSKNKNELFKNVGGNTGNIVYWESIIRLFNPDIIPYVENAKFADYDAVIITDLCWIRENVDYDYIESYIDKYDIPFIPMSIGLQNSNFNPNFKLSDQLVRMLNKMQRKAVLGVRGKYTASILIKHGITNIAVIGCPSMYYWNNRNLKIEDNNKPINVCCNFKSFGEKLNSKEVSILEYFAKHNFMFVEQTKGEIEFHHVPSKIDLQSIKKYLDQNTLLDFNYRSWCDRLKDYNFSLGFRFHGNVLPLQQNIKSLFITIDSRTQEMIDLFHLPHIKKEDFNINKSIEYYFNLADYNDFNANYPKMYDTFTKFVSDNNLEFSEYATPLKFVAKENVNTIDSIKTRDYSTIENNACQDSLSLKVSKNANRINYEIKLTGDLDNIDNKSFNIIYDCNMLNIIKDCCFDSVEDNGAPNWQLSHSKTAAFNIQDKKLKCGDEYNPWCVLSYKLNYADLKGQQILLSIKSQSVDNSKLNIAIRYKQNDVPFKYIFNRILQNDTASTDTFTLFIPNDLPDNTDLNVAIYLNESNSEAIVNEVKLFC